MDDDAARGQVRASAADVYEEFFVPALFSQWTEPMLDSARVRSGDRVLDVGCGTGVLTRAAAARVGPGGEVTGVDRNDAMLSVARRGGQQISWRLGAAEDLPFEGGQFDRVLSQFVLMFLDDRRRGLDEFARVLVPGGTVAVATWCAIEQSPGYAAMVDLVRRVVSDQAAEALLAPFCLGRVETVHGLLAPAFPDVVVTRHEGVARFASIEAWLHTDIRGWTLADMIDDTTFAVLLAEAQHELAEYIHQGGAVSFPSPALIATATKR
jgi:SAM-dependent methyltransferase